jgi:hypothetical protein
MWKRPLVNTSRHLFNRYKIFSSFSALSVPSVVQILRHLAARSLPQPFLSFLPSCKRHPPPKKGDLSPQSTQKTRRLSNPTS